MGKKKTRILLFLLLISTSFFSKVLLKNDYPFFWDITNITPKEFEIANVIKVLDEKRLLIEVDGKQKTIYMLGVSDEKHSINQSFKEEMIGFTNALCLPNSVVCIEYDWKKVTEEDENYALVWYKIGDFWVLHNLALINNGYGKYDKGFSFDLALMSHFEIAEQIAKFLKRGLWETSQKNKTKAAEEPTILKTDYTKEDYEEILVSLKSDEKKHGPIIIKTFSPDDNKSYYSNSKDSDTGQSEQTLTYNQVISGLSTKFNMRYVKGISGDDMYNGEYNDSILQIVGDKSDIKETSMTIILYTYSEYKTNRSLDLLNSWLENVFPKTYNIYDLVYDVIYSMIKYYTSEKTKYIGGKKMYFQQLRGSDGVVFTITVYQ